MMSTYKKGAIRQRWANHLSDDYGEEEENRRNWNYLPSPVEDLLHLKG